MVFAVVRRNVCLHTEALFTIDHACQDFTCWCTDHSQLRPLSSREEKVTRNFIYPIRSLTERGQTLPRISHTRRDVEPFQLPNRLTEKFVFTATSTRQPNLDKKQSF
jgi:hypothetical protein